MQELLLEWTRRSRVKRHVVAIKQMARSAREDGISLPSPRTFFGNADAFVAIFDRNEWISTPWAVRIAIGIQVIFGLVFDLTERISTCT